MTTTKTLERVTKCVGNGLHRPSLGSYWFTSKDPLGWRDGCYCSEPLPPYRVVAEHPSALLARTSRRSCPDRKNNWMVRVRCGSLRTNPLRSKAMLNPN